MARRVLSHTKRFVLYPLRMGKQTVVMNIRLWNTLFWDAWYPLPFDQKLVWLAFVSQTIGVLTLIELLLFKR